MVEAQHEALIATDRLKLRRVDPRDAGRIATLCDDFDVVRMTTRMPWPYRLDDAQEFLAGQRSANFQTDNVFAVDHSDDGLVGVIGLHMRGRHPELGYWFGRPYWGKGYATEAARGVLKWAKDVWKKKVVEAGHFTDNPASGGVLIKSGFLYTGDVEMKMCASRGEEVPVRQMVWLA